MIYDIDPSTAKLIELYVRNNPQGVLRAMRKEGLSGLPTVANPLLIYERMTQYVYHNGAKNAVNKILFNVEPNLAGRMYAELSTLIEAIQLNQQRKAVFQRTIQQFIQQRLSKPV